jgi:antitoxin component YwqK of YwqJK toxin-antitoxin module
MKKLLLLLLLTTSFSTFSFEIVRLVPCDGEAFIWEELIVQKEENMVVIEMILEDQSLSDTEKAEQIEVSEQMILEIDTHLSDLEKNCKQSPEGQFINGKRDGEWIWWDKYNREIKAGNYVNGSKEGPWFERIYTGHAYRTIQMNYKNDKLEGKWTHKFSYEGPVSRNQNAEKIYFLKRELKQAIEEGNQTTIKAIENVLQSFEMPKIIAEGYYVKGKREGFWTEFGNGGGNYINGIKDGTWIESDSKGNYINGLKDGTWTHWYSFGAAYKEEIYEDGVLIEKKFL